MEHIAVTSSQIASIAFDPSSEVMQTLFKRGGMYEYPEVKLEEFEQVLHPGPEFEHSVGKAFDQVIKKRKTFRKVEAAPAETSLVVADEAPAIQIAEPKPPVEVEAVSRKSTELTTQAKAIVVIDPPTQEQASQILLTIAAMRGEIASTFKPMKDAAFKAHRVVCEQEKTVDGPLAEAEAGLKNQIGSYIQEQRRLALVEENRLREAERIRAEEESRKAAEDAAIEDAIQLEASGNVEAAAAVLASPAPAPVRYIAPAPVAANVANVSGVTTRMEWDFRITNEVQIPREYMLVNESAIRSVGKSTKGKIRIAGIEFYEKPILSASRRG